MVFSRLQRPTQRTVLAVVVLMAGATAGLAQGKAPVPDTKVQARAQELIRDIYGKKYDAAKTSKQKTDLAKKLLDQAAESKGDPGSHFVLLRVAKDVAVLAADAETALDAVNRIVATYDVDAMEMRLACAKRLASAAKLSSQHGALAARVYALVDIAVAEDNFDAASQLGEIARVAAQKARNYPLLKQITARMEKLDEVRKAQAEYQTAVARLEESPTDPQANLAAGRYLCLSRGDWNRGIPMLALGSDPALKAPAVKELAGADSPDAQIAAGDAWWDLAQTKEGRERDSYLLRARHWYEQAQPKATSSLMKVRLQDRLEEIAKIERPTPRATSQEPHPSTRPLPRHRPPRVRGIQGWNPAAAQLLATLRGHTGAVRGLGFSRDGSTLVSGSEDKTVRLWDPIEARLREALPPLKDQVWDVAISPDGSLVAAASRDHTISLWDTAKRQFRAVLTGHTDEVWSVDISPNGALLASSSRDQTVRLWQTERGTLAGILHGHTAEIRWVTFAPNGSVLASAGGHDSSVRIWDVATGALRGTLMGHGGHVRSVAFSPDGLVLVSTSHDKTACLWDMATGKQRATLSGFAGAVNCAAFHPSGSPLVIGSDEKTLRILDTATGRLVRTLACEAGVRCVAFSPDGSLLATGEGNTVKLWGTDSRR